jgi:hypothetical protein
MAILKGAERAGARPRAAAPGGEEPATAAAAVPAEVAWFRWMFLRMMGFEVPAPPGVAFPWAPAAPASPPAG